MKKKHKFQYYLIVFKNYLIITKGNICEYLGVFLLIAQIYTFTWDFKCLDLGLEGDADDNGYNVMSQ